MLSPSSSTTGCSGSTRTHTYTSTHTQTHAHSRTHTTRPRAMYTHIFDFRIAAYMHMSSQRYFSSPSPRWPHIAAHLLIIDGYIFTPLRQHTKHTCKYRNTHTRTHTRGQSQFNSSCKLTYTHEHTDTGPLAAAAVAESARLCLFCAARACMLCCLYMCVQCVLVLTRLVRTNVFPHSNTITNTHRKHDARPVCTIVENTGAPKKKWGTSMHLVALHTRPVGSYAVSERV